MVLRCVPQARYDKPIANTFVVPAGVSFPTGYAACAAKPGGCEQGISDEKMDNPIVRLTWQVSPKNKFAAYSDRAMRLRGHAMGSLTDPTTASVVWHTPNFSTGSMKWTSTVTPRLLVEGGFSYNHERHDNLYQDGIAAPRNTAAWSANVARATTALATCGARRALSWAIILTVYNIGASTSYVTGTTASRWACRIRSARIAKCNNANADLYQVYNNLVPLQVTVLNTPISARSAGRQPWPLRPGLMALQQAHVQLRCAFRLRQAARDGSGRTAGSLRGLTGLRRHRPADVEERVTRAPRSCMTCLATARPPSAAASTIHDGGHYGLRRPLSNPTGLVSQNLTWTDLERRRHRAGRSWLRLPDGWLRKSLRQPAEQLRRPLAGALRSEPEPPMPAGVQRRRLTKCCRASR